jgi:hypothetical protein
VAETVDAVVLFGEAAQDAQDLAEHDLPDHHLLQQADPVLVVVEVFDLVAGDLVGESQVGGDLGRVAGVGLVGGDDLEGDCEVRCG